jgi:hypothetical protein
VSCDSQSHGKNKKQKEDMDMNIYGMMKELKEERESIAHLIEIVSMQILLLRLQLPLHQPLLATAIYANAVPEPLQNFEIHSNCYSL